MILNEKLNKITKDRYLNMKNTKNSEIQKAIT
jgi:hypothetical protein